MIFVEEFKKNKRKKIGQSSSVLWLLVFVSALNWQQHVCRRRCSFAVCKQTRVEWILRGAQTGIELVGRNAVPDARTHGMPRRGEHETRPSSHPVSEVNAPHRKTRKSNEKQQTSPRLGQSKSDVKRSRLIVERAASAAPKHNTKTKRRTVHDKTKRNVPETSRKIAMTTSGHQQTEL